jgi:RNA polymerase sigma-70 factor (ECF subfamily)
MQAIIDPDYAAAAERRVVGVARARITAEQLATEHGERVYRFALMVSRDRDGAQDLAQEALVRAIRALASYDSSRGTVEAWLWRIVVNAARDAGRVAGRRELLLERLAGWQRAEPAASPEALALDRIGDAELLARLRELPRRQRTLLALRYGADMPVAEISTHLGESPDAVKAAIRRALARLRQRMGRRA